MRPAPSIGERFRAKVDVRGENECWPWLGSVQSKGYGTLWPSLLAHRVAFALANGLDPLAMDPEEKVLHSCDNPPCCNPRHLSQGTSADNTQDMIRKGRDKPLHGSGYFVLTMAQAREIRSLHAGGVSMHELARRYGCHRKTIANVVHRVTYRERIVQRTRHA